MSGFRNKRPTKAGSSIGISKTGLCAEAESTSSVSQNSMPHLAPVFPVQPEFIQ